MTAPSPATPPLVVSVLGPMRATLGDREVRFTSRKAQAVLAYLAIEDTGGESRRQLVGLLWSESAEAQARASLRQAVKALRDALRAIGYDALRFERAELALPRGAIEVDAEAVLRQAASGDVHPLLLEAPRLHERLLHGFDELDPSFQVWLRARRQVFQDRLLGLLEPWLARPAASRTQRLRVARALLQLDPTHEAACRALMRLLAEAGDAAGAIRAYDALWRTLADDYDSEPALATQALVADIKLGRLEPVAAAQVPTPSATPPRIALLVGRFEMNGVPPDRAHLVDGFRYDLLARLVRFREWYVVDGPALPDGTAARVTAQYRIAATAYQAGPVISMILMLSEGDSGILVWSERFELTLDGWFGMQGLVVRRIAGALNAQISAGRLARMAVEPDVSLDGYDRWLRCQSMLLRFDPDDWDRAFLLLRDMTARAPGFAPAWSNLAQLDNVAHITRAGVRRDREREVRSLAHARAAVRADPNDSRSQLCLAWSLTMMGRYEQAELPLKLALELNPDDAWVLISSSQIHAFHGRHAIAAPLAAQSFAATLAPSRTHWGFYAANAFFAGDDSGAVEAAERAAEQIKTSQGFRAAALFHLGHRREAEAAAARFVALVRAAWHPPEPATEAAIAHWFLHLFPLRRAADWARLRDGIGGAGLPVEGAAHGAWYD